MSRHFVLVLILFEGFITAVSFQCLFEYLKSFNA